MKKYVGLWCLTFVRSTQSISSDRFTKLVKCAKHHRQFFEFINGYDDVLWRK